MIAVLIIFYVATLLLIFRVFKVKVNPWSIATSATVGVLMIGLILVLWTIAAPISSRAVVGRYVVPIVPWVKGKVISIPTEPNVPIRKGEVLYKVDPTPYQYAVNQIQAQLQAAKSNVKQLEAGIRVAEASIAKFQADARASKAALEVAEATATENKLAISELNLVRAREQFAAAEAAVNQAQASLEQANSALAAGKDAVVTVESQLSSAQFDLNECTVTAPADGFITNWQIREGTFVVPMPFAAAGTFIDTSETMIFAPFPAQMLTNVKPGQDVEMAFKSKPGWLFRGKVEAVIQASGEGQLAATGTLPSASSIGSRGVLAVKIRLNDDEPVDELEMGSAGTVAIYTDWGKPFGIISKVSIRMKKWMYFLPI